MKLLAELSQLHDRAAPPLFVAEIALAEAAELIDGTRAYGAAYMAEILEEVAPLVEQGAPPAREIADRLLGGQRVELRAANVDRLEEAIQIIANACQQMLGYLLRARAFEGRRVWEIEPREDYGTPPFN